MPQNTNQAQIFRGPVEFHGSVEFPTSSHGDAITPGTGVAVTFDKMRPVRHVRLTLTNFVIAVTAALDYGGTKLCDLPDSNVLIMGCEVDLAVVKGGVTNGIVAATDLKMGVGTATAGAIPIATTAVNVLDATDITTDALAVAFDKHTNDNASPVIVFGDDDAAAALFLNASATGGITADDTLTVNGTVDLYYVDTGNVTS